MVWILSILLSFILLTALLTVVYPELIHFFMPWVVKDWQRSMHYRHD